MSYQSYTQFCSLRTYDDKVNFNKETFNQGRRQGKFRALKARAARGVWGHAHQKLLKSRGSDMHFPVAFFFNLGQKQDGAIASSCLMLATALSTKLAIGLLDEP